MLRRLYLSLLFAILLVFAQQSAMLHPYVHTADLQQTSQDDKQAPKHSEVCGKCVAFANLGAAVSSQAYLLSIASSQLELATTLHPSIITRRVLPYQSRAPPILA